MLASRLRPGHLILDIPADLPLEATSLRYFTYIICNIIFLYYHLLRTQDTLSGHKVGKKLAPKAKHCVAFQAGFISLHGIQ